MHSLRNLDLAVPNGEQIVALIDADPRAEKQLAQQLAVPVRIELSEEDAGSAVMDAALMSGATEAMLENYNTTLKKETDMLVREVENLKKPIKLKRVPLKALLAAQDATIRRREVERAAGTSENGRVYIPRQIMDTEHTYCSERPLSELSRIDWDDLCAPKRFEHKYLLVQVASRLALYASCSFVGVTPNGGALPVSIAHFTPNLHLHGPELDALLPVGTKLLIREPYLSQHYLGVGGPITGDKGVVGVRVDTPSDVHVLDDDAPVLRGVTWTHDLDAPMPSDVLWRQEGPVSRAPSHAAPFISRERVQSAVRALLDQERPGAAWREVRAADRAAAQGAAGRRAGRADRRLQRMARRPGAGITATAGRDRAGAKLARALPATALRPHRDLAPAAGAADRRSRHAAGAARVRPPADLGRPSPGALVRRPRAGYFRPCRREPGRMTLFPVMEGR